MLDGYNNTLAKEHFFSIKKESLNKIRIGGKVSGKVLSASVSYTQFSLKTQKALRVILLNNLRVFLAYTAFLMHMEYKHNYLALTR